MNRPNKQPGVTTATPPYSLVRNLPRGTVRHRPARQSTRFAKTNPGTPLTPSPPTQSRPNYLARTCNRIRPESREPSKSVESRPTPTPKNTNLQNQPKKPRSVHQSQRQELSKSVESRPKRTGRKHLKLTPPSAWSQNPPSACSPKPAIGLAPKLRKRRLSKHQPHPTSTKIFKEPN